jgi:hypothetical protein
MDRSKILNLGFSGVQPSLKDRREKTIFDKLVVSEETKAADPVIHD